MSSDLTPSTVRQLDACLARLADAVMAGDDDGARQAFADAQSLPALRSAGAQALVWAELEVQVAGLVDVDAFEGWADKRQVGAWTRSRRRLRAAAQADHVGPGQVGVVPSEGGCG